MLVIIMNYFRLNVDIIVCIQIRQRKNAITFEHNRANTRPPCEQFVTRRPQVK